MSRIHYIGIATGGRDYTDKHNVFEWLDELALQFPLSHLIHGDCKTGADRLCDMWACERGVQPVRCPPNWTKHGKAGGPIRNSDMVALRPQIGIAFPGGTGTADCVTKLRSAKVPVVVVSSDPITASQIALRISLNHDLLALETP